MSTSEGVVQGDEGGPSYLEEGGQAHHGAGEQSHPDGGGRSHLEQHGLVQRDEGEQSHYRPAKSTSAPLQLPSRRGGPAEGSKRFVVNLPSMRREDEKPPDVEITFYWAPYTDENRNRQEFPNSKMVLEDVPYDTTVATLMERVGETLGLRQGTFSLSQGQTDLRPEHIIYVYNRSGRTRFSVSIIPIEIVNVQIRIFRACRPGRCVWVPYWSWFMRKTFDIPVPNTIMIGDLKILICDIIDDPAITPETLNVSSLWIKLDETWEDAPLRATGFVSGNWVSVYVHYFWSAKGKIDEERIHRLREVVVANAGRRETQRHKDLFEKGQRETDQTFLKGAGLSRALTARGVRETEENAISLDV